jgi:ABC-type nitrate/sulfonate/bicarbonate transport system substrate-binding protein
MKKPLVFIRQILIIVVIQLIAVSCTSRPQTSAIRVGWATTWATQGQLMETLQHTKILANLGVNVSFTPFLTGPEESEAALGGSLDVVSGAAQPMLQLVAKGNNWVIVARNAYVRVAILVPPNSKAQKLSDLEGQEIAVPIGTTAENLFLFEAQSEGLNPSDFLARNIGIDLESDLVRNHKNDWGEFKAIATWDPTATVLQNMGGRVIVQRNDLTLIVMSRSFIKEHHDLAVAYLRGVMQGWQYYATHKSEADQEYLRDSGLAVDPSTLDRIAENEPNASASTIKDVNISLTPDMIQQLQNTADLLTSTGKIDHKLDVRSNIDIELVQAAQL